MLASLALGAMLLQANAGAKPFFPIAVWLQNPRQAAKYKAAGFNLYVGLWKGPTEEQLSALSKAGMRVVCEQNVVGLQHRADPIIYGWMHQDEPDNAQASKDADGKPTWGPCVPPNQIVDKYRAMKAADPSRPVLLNLGQGVANDQWIGRGNGSSLSDYETYVKGGDIVSFDIYPVAGLGDPGKLNLVGKGIDRLRRWCQRKQRIWNCLECTAISGKSKPSPAQVKAEAWSAIIHGSRGLIFFVHQFEPAFNEHAILDDPEMLRSVTSLNEQIQSLAPVLLNSSATVERVRTTSPEVEAVCFRTKGSTVMIAVSLGRERVRSGLTAPKGSRTARVDGEVRQLPVADGNFEDVFEPYQVHVYKLANAQETARS
jgi:hypothetical protein